MIIVLQLSTDEAIVRSLNYTSNFPFEIFHTEKWHFCYRVKRTLVFVGNISVAKKKRN